MLPLIYALAHFIFAVSGVDPLTSPPIDVSYAVLHADGWTPYAAASPGSFFFQTHLIGSQNRTQVWSYQYDKTFPANSSDLPRQLCVRVALGRNGLDHAHRYCTLNLTLTLP